LHWKKFRGLLNKNKDLILGNRELTEKIVIGTNDSYLKEDQGRYSIHISLFSSELEIINLFSLVLPSLSRKDFVERELRSAVPQNIIVRDLVGLSKNEIQNVSAKLSQATSTVDFNNDRKFAQIYLSNYFAVVPEGMVIDIRSSSTEIAHQLVMAITARRMWTKEVEPLLFSLSLTMVYQSGVFSGEELIEVIDFVKKNTNTIKSVTNSVSKFYVGKKFDYNLQNGEILLNFKASENEITGFLLKTVPTKVNFNFDAAKKNLLLSFSNRNLNLDQIVFHFNPSAETLAQIRLFTENVVPYLHVDKMNELGIKILHLTLTEPSSLVSSSVLFAKMGTGIDSAHEINAILANTQIRWIHEELMREIQDYASRSGISISSSTGIYPALSVNKGLVDFKTWLFEKNIDYWTIHRIQTINLVLDQSTTTQIKSNILILNLVDFSKEKIEKILK